MSNIIRKFHPGSYVTVRHREDEWSVVVGYNGQVVARPMTTNSRDAAFSSAIRMAETHGLECLVQGRPAHG